MQKIPTKNNTPKPPVKYVLESVVIYPPGEESKTYRINDPKIAQIVVDKDQGVNYIVIIFKKGKQLVYVNTSAKMIKKEESNILTPQGPKIIT